MRVRYTIDDPDGGFKKDEFGFLDYHSAQAGAQAGCLVIVDGFASEQDKSMDFSSFLARSAEAGPPRRHPALPADMGEDDPSILGNDGRGAGPARADRTGVSALNSVEPLPGASTAFVVPGQDARAAGKDAAQAAAQGVQKAKDFGERAKAEQGRRRERRDDTARRSAETASDARQTRREATKLAAKEGAGDKRKSKGGDKAER